MALRYRVTSPATLKRVALDELTAVYHRASGQTHLLAEPAPEILDALAEAPLTRGVLLERLAERFDLTDANAEALDARLDELVATGLVAAT